MTMRRHDLSEDWTDEQIEAAAMAIRETFGNRSGRGAPWHRLSEHIKNQYRAEARAALDAAAAVGKRMVSVEGTDDEAAA
jgi:hypothetical protein